MMENEADSPRRKNNNAEMKIFRNRKMGMKEKEKKNERGGEKNDVGLHRRAQYRVEQLKR